jgi:transaldolase / glucose-6-phosphate isomerase
MNTIARLAELGQSLWMDNIQRHALEDGETKALIDRGDIRGMTSNPTIFDHAITKTDDYKDALTALAWAGWDAQKIFWELAVEDVRAAADLFAPLYERSNGADGFVSIEVSPTLAADTEGTIAQAQQLWVRVARPNLMVKIPATPAGIPAIRRSIAAGLNINITLIFSRQRYAEVMEAFMAGLEDRLATGQSIDHIASVASFFVSRVDSKVDQRLPEDSPVRGKAAIANAKLAYEDFLKTFAGPRWDSLRARGARIQRPLWASTSTKNPAYPDTMYVDSLIGHDTINTVPPLTLDAFREHGRPEISVTRGLDEARDDIARLEQAGIKMDEVTHELEIEGVQIFSNSMAELINSIDAKRKAAVGTLGVLMDPVARRIASLEAESIQSRLWAHDPTLWTNDPAGQAEVEMRMGWTDSPEKARLCLPSYAEFAGEVQRLGIHRFLVLGMGGSSLTAEVLSSLFAADDSQDPGVQDGSAVCLGILDSTDPAQVSQAAKDYPPDQSLYLVASKSGGTAEVTAAFDYFWAQSKGDGSRFVATTDARTSLEDLARRLRFKRIFTSDETVGGRYSALTDFGLVPATLLGIQVDRLLDRAQWMQGHCGRDMPAARSPGITLGAFLGEAALAGRDKLTVVADTSVRPLANWLEQLVAESSGKDGKGIVPVPLEPLDAPEVYQDDRVFVYLRRTGELDAGIQALSHAGFPCVILGLGDQYDVGAEFVRWEIAVAVACHILGVNAFDQPDVQQSKDRTKAEIEQFRKSGNLAEGKWDVLVPRRGLAESDRQKLLGFVQQAKPGEYIALNVYLPRNGEMIDALQGIRVAIRERTHSAVTAGFGPRFQHSTGQLHKGGPNTGLFIQVTSDAPTDMNIPTEGLSFGTLLRAQALGDYETLIDRGRRVLRVHLDRPEDIGLLLDAFR